MQGPRIDHHYTKGLTMADTSHTSTGGRVLYTPTEDDINELMKRFDYHKPHGDQPSRYEAIRQMLMNASLYIMGRTPKSREQSIVLTKLEEAMFWTNAAIARNEEENNG